MHIIFGHVSYWQVPILRLLKYFKFEVFYLYIDAKTKIKKNDIATKLKNKNIYPLPLELEKKIFIKSILSALGTSITPKTTKVLNKQRVPRKKISDSIPLNIYKRFGWTPPIKGFSEKEELNLRRDFVIKEGVQKKYLDILDSLSEDYEKKYFDSIM